MNKEEIKKAIESRKALLEIQRTDYEKIEFLGKKIGDIKLFQQYIEALNVIIKKLISDKRLKIYFGYLTLNKKWLDCLGQLEDVLHAAYPIIINKKSNPFLMGYLYAKLYHSAFGQTIMYFRNIAIKINDEYRYIKKARERLTDRHCLNVLIDYDSICKFLFANFDIDIRNCIAHENFKINIDNTIDFFPLNNEKFTKSFIDIGMMFSSFSLMNNALINVITLHEIKILERYQIQ